MKKDIKEMRGAICTMEKFGDRDYNSVGSSRIRGRWLLNYWKECEEYKIGKKYDFLIFQKVYWSSFKNEGNYKGIKILDLCDPDWLEGQGVFEYVDWVDAVVTSTEPLAEYVRKLRPNKLVRCIPDRVYLPEANPKKERHEGILKNLVWFGYSQNFHYLHSTFDELMSRGITLTVLSNIDCEPPLVYRNRLKIKNIPYNYDSINKEIVKADAVLMPESVGNERGKYKSNNKTIQSWALRMPVIKEPKDLDRFQTAEAREREADLRYNEVVKKYDVALSVKEYMRLLAEINTRHDRGE